LSNHQFHRIELHSQQSNIMIFERVGEDADADEADDRQEMDLL